MKQVEAVFFDLFGTFYPYPAKRDRAEEVRGQMFRIGYNLTRDQIARAIRKITPVIENRCLADPRFAQEKKFHSQAYYFEWYRLFLAEFEINGIGLGFNQLDQLVLELFEEYYFDEGFKLHEQVIPVINFLRRKGIKVGLVTNATSGIRKLLRHDRVHELFNPLIISGEVGFEKPDAQIFQIALAKTGVRPANAIYVGDSRDTDYDGAQKVGMRPILIDWHHHQTHTEDLTVIPDLFALQHFV